MDTLDDTFALFFGNDDTIKQGCIDCGSENGLTILYTTESGTSVRVCQTCKARRVAAQRESEAREAARMAKWDAWNAMQE